MADDTTEPVIQYANELLAYGLGDTYSTVTVGGAKIILQSAQIASEGESKTYKDNTGTTTALVIPETYQTVQCEGLMIKASSITPPKKGDKVTDLPLLPGMVTGKTWRVESFSASWSNEDVTKVSMQVRSYNF